MRVLIIYSLLLIIYGCNNDSYQIESKNGSFVKNQKLIKYKFSDELNSLEITELSCIDGCKLNAYDEFFTFKVIRVINDDLIIVEVPKEIPEKIKMMDLNSYPSRKYIFYNYKLLEIVNNDGHKITNHQLLENVRAYYNEKYFESLIESVKNVL